MESGPARAALVGLGHRTHVYASFALAHPDRMSIVALADPDGIRLAHAAEKYGIPPERCFEDAATLAASLPVETGVADMAINGTMDSAHHSTTMSLLRAGYDVLLEKPIAGSLAEVVEIDRAAREGGRLVAVCHVLRHAPFYRAIAERVRAGDIGRIVAMSSSEHISDHHTVTGFVRGKWRRRSENPMLLAKCCHDLDLLCWLKPEARPVHVSSMGGSLLFTSENAPEGAGTRCVVDCDIEAECPHSARRIHIEHGLWRFYAWHGLPAYERGGMPSEAEMLASLADDNPYGRCVWTCDNDVVDQQSVLIEFDDGTIASHRMHAGTPMGRRRIHLIGEHGEIEGVMEEGRFTIRNPKPSLGLSFDIERIDDDTFEERIIDVGIEREMHGGGDLRLVADFLRIRSDGEASISTTSIHDSIAGHAIAFAADEAMIAGGVVKIGEDWSCGFLPTG